VLAALPTKSATNKFLIGTNQQSGLWILLEIIERNLVPAGIVSVQEFLALKSRLFTYIIEHKQSSPNELMIEFEKWVVTNKKLQTTSGLALLYEAIKNVEFKSDTAQAKVYSELKSRLIKNREEHIVFHSLPKSLEGFLQIHEGISKIRYASSSSLTVRLMAIREKEEQQISLWLGLSEFRTTLFKDLSIKELQAFITDLIHPIQRQYFISGFSLYQESKLLSVGQRKILEFKYLELILISLSTRSLDTWSHQNWAFLLTEIGKLELGEKRTIELILNLQESVVGSPKQNNEVYITLITSVLEELSQISHAQAPKVKNYQWLKNDEQEIEEKDYKKLGEKEPHELIDPLFIDNAGLILLWPFLAMLFDRCGLTINGDFLEDQNRHKAALLLHYAATGSVDLDTPETTIHKVLCGIHPTFPLDQGVDVNVENLKVVDGLLYNITQQWSPLKGTSIDSLRSSFIQREGRLEEEEDRFYMIIEKKAFDMLLNQIPWNIDKIKLSWMHKMLEVEWNT